MFKKISTLLGSVLLLSSTAAYAAPQTCYGMVEPEFRNSKEYFYNLSFATVTKEGVQQHGFINTEESGYPTKKIPFACGGTALGQLRVTIAAYRKDRVDPQSAQDIRVIWSGDCLYQLSGDAVMAYHKNSEIPKKPMHEGGRREYCFRAEFVKH